MNSRSDNDIQNSSNKYKDHRPYGLADSAQDRDDTVEGDEKEGTPDIYPEIGYGIGYHFFRCVGQAENRFGKNDPGNGKDDPRYEHKDEEGGEGPLNLVVLLGSENCETTTEVPLPTPITNDIMK